VRGSRARGCGKAITPIKVFKFSKKLMRSPVMPVGRALSEATSESALFTLPFRSASERAALRLPRVVETHSGAPEPQVSHSPHSLAPRASFPDHRARTPPDPPPLSDVVGFRTKKRILRIVRAEESV
jgi:hypothetical protein